MVDCVTTISITTIAHPLSIVSFLYERDCAKKLYKMHFKRRQHKPINKEEFNSQDYVLKAYMNTMK